MSDTFVELIGHPHYYINRYGLIKREYFFSKGKDGKTYRRKSKIRSSYVSCSTGYSVIEIQGKHYSMHRLVATHFIPNPENKRTVNHKDGNKLNYRDDNLEWATDSENIQHAYDNGMRYGAFLGRTGMCHHRSRAGIQINTITGEQKRFESARQASLSLNRCAEYVSAFIRRNKVHNGIIWKYDDKYSG